MTPLVAQQRRPARGPAGDIRAVRGLLLSQVDLAIALVDPRRRPTDRKIHETRKAIKRSRALLKLLRPALAARSYDSCRKNLRDASRAIATVRDARVLQDTMADMARRTGIPAASVQLQRTKSVADGTARSTARHGKSALNHLATVRRRLARIPVRTAGWKSLGTGIRTIYDRGRRRMPAPGRAASTQELHEWRKDVKSLWHALEAFEPLNPARVRPVLGDARRLAQALGDDHDLAMLAARIAADAGVKTRQHLALEASIEARRRRLQQRAMTIGTSLYAERPREFERRLRHEWQAWLDRAGDSTP